MMRVLVCGAKGQVGFELVRALQGLGSIVGVDRSQFDLSRPDKLSSVLERVEPDVIVNAAAYTAVDQAESEEDTAMTVNCIAPKVIAKWAAEAGAALIHYSTDYVFDGSGSAPWTEDAATRPLSAYGRTKLAGEEAVKESGCRHLIFRTSWVYATRGRNFVRTMLRLSREREELQVISDQRGAPTWARTVAQVTAHVLARAGVDRTDVLESIKQAAGIYHLTATGETSWYEFAKFIFENAPDEGRRLKHLRPISASDYQTPARRPENSRLSVDKLAAVWGLAPPNWQDALLQCLDEIRANQQV